MGMVVVVGGGGGAGQEISKAHDGEMEEFGRMK